MSGRVISWCAVFLVLAPMVAGAQALPVKTAKPRDLSEAERAAVELAAAYLQGGPAAWWERLAAGSPIRRSGREAALAEIAARVGPADGATWQLLTPGHADPERAVFGVEYASGLEETLTLRLVQEGGWKLAEIRTTVDRRDGAPGASSTPADPAPVEPAASRPAAALPFANPYFTLGLAALVLLVGALAALALGQAGRKGLAVAVGAVAVGLVAAGLVWTGSPSRLARSAGAAGGTGAAAGAEAVAAHGGLSGFAALAPLRAALASGSDRAEIEKRLLVVPGDPHLREVQQLWRAAYLLGEGDLTG
ncbi:MAG TPA: hypothetical protein VFE33_34960, partial [Thermoanaerobaculia bacterium]|nr:hypothetical protein [Thermoanaerobaculia bacterium]